MYSDHNVGFVGDEPYLRSDAKNLIFLCGTHGVGKSTVGKLLTQYYSKNYNAFYLREMQFKPDLKAGTPDFQDWYWKQMNYRNSAIDGLLSSKIGLQPDVLIVDRMRWDVAVYTHHKSFNINEAIEFLAHELVYETGDWSNYFKQKGDSTKLNVIVILINREANYVMKSLKTRMQEGDEIKRKEWDEDNREKWEMINTTFYRSFVRAIGMMDNLLLSGVFDNIELAIVNNNETPERMRDEIISYVDMMMEMD